MAGYGIFWAVIEDLYNNANALRLDCDGIAFELRVDSDTVKSVLHDFDLFIFDGETFGSLSVQNRLYERDLKSKKASASARKRWDSMRTHSERNASAMLKRKGKERKGKKLIPPKLEDFRKYFQINGYSQFSADKAYNHYVTLNWCDSQGKPVTNWKNKVSNNWFKPENKEQRKGRAAV